MIFHPFLKLFPNNHVIAAQIEILTALWLTAVIIIAIYGAYPKLIPIIFAAFVIINMMRNFLKWKRIERYNANLNITRDTEYIDRNGGKKRIGCATRTLRGKKE